MYKLLHKLFGWDYVAWWNSADQGIARVQTSPGGTPYYWRYKSTKVLDKITEDSRVVFLTCPSSKYLPTKI